MKKAEQWMLERLEMSDGLGAIYPGIMNSIIALRCLGYSLDDPQVIRAMDEFEKLGIEEETTFRMQPCMSPVWDTAYAIFALAESGVSATDHAPGAALRVDAEKAGHAQGRLVREEPLRPSPRAGTSNSTTSSIPTWTTPRWCMLALSRVKTSNESYQDKSVQRALDWVLSMQCKNGGWASFDKDNDRMVFQQIPFADHNAMLDPATVDITGRVLECLATYGYSMKDEPVRRAVEFIKREQEPDGSWFGRWGVNYIYGTMLVLRGLEAIGMDHHEPCIQQAAEWLRMMQNPDGGWGETCGSYDDPNTKGVGPSTASQTAWAVMGLLAASDTRSDSLQRGVAYLLKTQLRDGSWDEAWYTGTGFPRVFYLMYYMYRQYFPLIALTAYAKASAASQEEQLRIARVDRRNTAELGAQLPIPGFHRSQSASGSRRLPLHALRNAELDE